ncbi:teleost multiple tissue opsin b [Dicentrarchus labrax]|uniref:Teleost multiple tissue opsin b n=1 Tax=Dicentrarchus labrax TaxID=13489 RepID=E6ZJD5_DICLA|nr:teleost multiple tissue opsin b [Dicentrarchus labrax]CBN82169.1 Tmtops protein [Dicentrarchus labrax]
MIVCNVSLSCAHCPGGGAGGTAATATDAYEQVPGSFPPVTLSPKGHLVVAVCLGFIGTFGFLSNFLVLALFCRYRALRTPMNLLLVSISASDLLVSVLGTPFSFAASTQGRWLIGRAGCVWYGFVNACLGIVSLISLAVLSYERYCTMMAPTIANGREYRPALGGICFSWLYSVAWTVPPLLGWSRYGPEGPGTTCSVDWKTKTANNISYIICLFTFCLVLPFCVILYSYGKLLYTIRQVSSVSSVVTRRREQRVLVMVVTMVLCYLVCWLPYGVVALLATFGPHDFLTPEASITPSLLAKFSTVINPFIYIFMNKQFYRCFRAFLSCSTPERGSTLKTFSRPTKTLRTVRQDKEHHVSAPAPCSAHSTPNSIHESSQRGSHVAPSPSNRHSAASNTPADANSPKPILILVAHYRE